MLPSLSRPKPGQGLRCHLAGLLFGTSVLFLVTVLAVIVAHKELVSVERAAGLLQSAELEVQQLANIALSGHQGVEPPPRFVYHTFRDATGRLSTPMPRVLPTPPPPPPAPTAWPPPPPVSSVFVRPSLPARLSGSALPATEVLRQHGELSKEAYAASQQQYPEMDFDPPGGPLSKVMLPLVNSSQPSQPGKYHVVVTADYGKYGRWQTLVNYYSYLKIKAEHPDSALGGYTRILHCSQADDIMHLVPTLVVEHLPPGIDRGYGPMHRPWAFAQWLSRMQVPEEYIFMTEPDHVFVSPPPLVATSSVPAAFPFFYVDCKAPQWKPHCENPLFNAQRVPVERIPRTGNSPTMISKAMMIEMLPRWDHTVRAIHADLEADKALGWAQEMFAFSLALANHPLGPPEVSYHQEFMAQPPFDKSLIFDKCQASIFAVEQREKQHTCTLEGAERFVNVSIIHYTYGQDFDEQGKHTYGKVGPWHWDKRDYGAQYPDLPIVRPAEGTPETVFKLIETVEEAGFSDRLWDWWRANMKEVNNA